VFCGKIGLRLSEWIDGFIYAHSLKIVTSLCAIESNAIPAPDTSVRRIGRVHPSHLGQLHGIDKAGEVTGFRGSRPGVRAGTTIIISHVIARGKHCAHSGKDSRSTGVSERQALSRILRSLFQSAGFIIFECTIRRHMKTFYV
jgi:hypothetical protein